MTKQPSSLPGFAHNWIGGDPHGLAGLADTLYGYQPEIEDVTTTLNGKVGQLVTDAGWSGDAADAFRDHWEGDSLSAQALATVIESVGDVVDHLAVSLAQLESGLETAADEARKQGAPVSSNGTLMDGPVPAAAEQISTEYGQLRQAYLDTATDARDQATGALQRIYASIAPPPAGDDGTSPADTNTVADYLRGFWAIPSAYRKSIDTKVAKLRSKAATAKAEWIKARDSRPSPNIKMPKDVKDALHDARADLQQARTTLADAEQIERKLPFNKLFDTRLSTVFTGLAKGSDAAGDLNTLGKLQKWMGDVPVVDVAAASVGTILNAMDDVDKGQPLFEALPEDALANVGGLAAGAVAGTAVAGGIAGAAFVGAPVAAVAVGAAVGGAVAFGVGDFVDNAFHEHWDEDIHQDGVVGGIADGISDAGSKTWDDAKHVASGIGHAASSVWHGIFG
jgi:uncharacterized protein YukE